MIGEPGTTVSAKKGIAVVHGVGAAHQSDTVLDLGKPLLDWVQRWMAVRCREARYEEAGLPFGTLDDPRTAPAHVTLRVDGTAGPAAAHCSSCSSL